MCALHSGLVGVALAALLFCAPASAHDGPEHEIEELTERINKEGATADLLLQRAIEYNVLNKGAEAAKDLERALEFEPHSAAMHRELGRAYFVIGKTNEALDTVKRGLTHAEEGPERASLHMLRAEIRRARKEFDKALEDAERAIREHPENAEWYYARSQLQQQLKLNKERIKGLEDGVRETGSGLLEAELIEAFIDGGQSERALEKIEAELKDSRWRSTWLIRRAKASLASGKKDEAKADLQAALIELNRRITTSATDPMLLADRGMTRELLGEKEDARKDYESARDKGMTDEWLRERIKSLKEAEDKEKEQKAKEEKARKAAGTGIL